MSFVICGFLQSKSMPESNNFLKALFWCIWCSDIFFKCSLISLFCSTSTLMSASCFLPTVYNYYRGSINLNQGARMNNLQIFRKQIDNYLQAEEIASLEKWKEMLDHLCDLKILSAKQVKVLNQNVAKRSFPIQIKQFEEIIMKQFGDEGTKRLMKDIEQIQQQIKEAKGVLAVWRQQGLTKSEIRALQIIFSRGNNKMKQICNVLTDKKQLLQSISEPEIQMIRAMDEWTIMQKVKRNYKDFEEFQQINGKAIDNLYNQIRVREVYFRSKKPSKPSEDQIITVSGFNSKTDEEVEVTKIPKNLTNFDKMNTQLVTFNALRDLSLSPYFVRFLGYNTNADANYYYYFRENIETRNLQNLIKNSTALVEEQYTIFKYWAGEIFRAFRDIFMQCSYEPVLPIKLRDIEVTDYGLRVILKHVKFNNSREPNDGLEPLLLENLARVILELLKISESEIETRIKYLQNRNLLFTLLKSKEGLDKYNRNIVPCYINFYNAQTHPLFQAIQQTQAMEIIDNYTMLFSDQT